MKPEKRRSDQPGKLVDHTRSRSRKLRKSAEHALIQKDYSLAEASFRDAITLSAEDNKSKLGLAWTFYYVGKLREAITIVEFLLLDHSYPKGTLHLKALLLCQEERYPEAEEAYLQALREDNNLKDSELENAIWGLI